MPIRKATIEDISMIVKLELQVFQESLGESFLYDEMMLNPFSNILIMEDQFGFIGYIGLRIDDHAELMNFAILPSRQHHGYGTQLLTYVLKLLKEENVDILTLEVRQSNHIAQKLYEKLGFKKSHIRKNYYPNEDAIVYMKEVNT